MGAHMRLAAIICVWSDCADLLPSCVDNIAPVVDGVIIMWSKTSNHFIEDDRIFFTLEQIDKKYRTSGKIYFEQVEPKAGLHPRNNETLKRNKGLTWAYGLGFTHFIMMDSDEYYKQDELLQDKERFKNPDLNGMVHRLKVFVGKPTLCCDDHTLVPGIHKLSRNTEMGSFKTYPFTYDKQGNAHIDPTRRVSYTHGIIMSDFYMWHFSYVRKDIDLKIQNSSANLKNSEAVIKRDIANAKPGYVSELYHRSLEEVSNYFNIAI